MAKQKFDTSPLFVNGELQIQLMNGQPDLEELGIEDKKDCDSDEEREKQK